MKLTMRLTVSDLVRALNQHVHGLADELEKNGKRPPFADRRKPPAKAAAKGRER